MSKSTIYDQVLSFFHPDADYIAELNEEIERLRNALKDVLESWSVHNAAVIAARALGHENVLELAQGAAKSAEEIQRLRDLLQASLDLQAAEQATSNELKRQMDVLAYNYTKDEKRWEAENVRLQAALERYANHDAWGFRRIQGYANSKGKPNDGLYIIWYGENHDGWDLAERALQDQPVVPKSE